MPICILFSKGLTGQNLEDLLHKADSFNLLIQIEESDSVLTIILSDPQTPLLARFKAETQYAINYVDLFEFQKANVHLSATEELLGQIPKDEHLALGRYYLAKARSMLYNSTFLKAQDLFAKAVYHLSQDPELWPELVTTYLFFSQNYFRLNQPNYHKLYIDQAFSLLYTNESRPDLLGHACLQLGRYYRLKGQWDRFLEQAQLSEGYFNQAFGPNHPEAGVAVQYQSHYYEQRGDYAEQLKYLIRAQQIWENNGTYLKGRLGQNAGLISNCYQKLGRYKEAHRYVDLAISKLFEHLGDRKVPILGDMHRRKAQIYEAQGNTDLAIKYFNIARAYYPEQTTNRDKTRTYQGLARSFLARNNIDSALYWNKLDFENIFKTFGPDYIFLAENYRIAGQLQSMAGDKWGALATWQMALEKAAPGFKAMNWRDLPEAADFEFIPPVLGILNRKGKVLRELAEEENDSTYLNAAFRTYLCGIELIDLLRQSYQEEEGKQIIQEEGAGIYQGAIECLTDIYNKEPSAVLLDSLFGLVNRGKALLLREAIADKAARHYAGIPDSLIEKEYSLRLKLTRLKYQKNANNSVSIANKNVKETQETQDALDKLRLLFKKEYPKYYSLKYADSRIGITQLRKNLERDEALVQYVMTESKLLVFVLHQKDARFFVRTIPENFNTEITQFLQSISDLNFIQKDKPTADQQLLSSGTELGQLLLSEIIQDLPSQIKRLCLVPDGILGYLPFDLLLLEKRTEIEAYRTLPFAFKSYAFRYMYTPQSLLENEEFKQPIPSLRFAGFAPSYQTESTTSVEGLLSLLRGNELKNLPGAKKEVEELKGIMGGNAWFGADASEANFKRHAKQYGLLHLSMHGLLNDDDPMQSYLAFQQIDSTQQEGEDGLLKVAELYALPLSAEMVVLSACNTGTGKLSRGEGIMSLARAFRYSGVQSILMSLWSVPDDSTADLMGLYYKQLKEGKAKDKALQSARLAYLEQVQDPVFSHPYFWSGFVLIGDARAIPFSNWTLGLSVVGILIAFYLIWRIFLRTAK